VNSAKTYLLLCFALWAAVASFFVWRQHQELIELRSAALNPAERANLQKRAWDAEKRVHQIETQLAAVLQRQGTDASGSLGSTTSSPIDTGSPNSAQSRLVGDVVNNMLSAMNDPEYQKLMAQQQRAQISSHYADLFRKLGLPPEKLDQFKNLLLEKQTLRNDVMLAATQQGINPLTNPEEFKQLESSLQAEVDNKIKATLGDDSYAQFQTYQDTQGQRNVVRQLQDSLSYTPTPMSSAQSDQMLQILGQTGSQKANSNQKNANNNTVTDETMTAAQTVLSRDQLKALKEIQEQQQAGTALNQIMRAHQGSTPGLPIARP
jgi:hypothetical protein